MFRLIDIFLSLLLLLVSFLPMSIIAIIILLDDGKPVIFRQTRVGRGLRPFTILKFRTMRQDNLNRGSGEAARSGDVTDKIEARARFRTTVPNDKRITRIGKIIRMSHSDELPQLFNVLKGEMSLVGVRPDTPSQEVDYSEDYWRKRHKFLPGITGLAQVMLKPKGTLRERCELEQKWNNERSLSLYCRILTVTLVKVFRRSSF